MAHYYGALRCASYTIETSHALGYSNRLSADVYEDMDNSKYLYEMEGIRIPRRVTLGQEIFFEKLKRPLQILAIQKMSILRFHPEAVDYLNAIINTRLPNELSAAALERAQELVESFPLAFGLDSNTYPEEVKVDNCPTIAFERHPKMNFIFVDTLDEFFGTPTPHTGEPMGNSLRASSSTFINKLHSCNIMLAY